MLGVTWTSQRLADSKLYQTRPADPGPRIWRVGRISGDDLAVVLIFADELSRHPGRESQTIISDNAR